MNYKKIFSRNNIIRSLLLVVSVVIISFFLPRSDKFEYEYSLRKPWSYGLLTAPFDIPINLDSLSIKMKRDSIDEHFADVYIVNRTIRDTQLHSLSGRLLASNSNSIQRSHLYNAVKSVYDRGIVDNSTFDKIKSGQLPELKMLVNNVASPVTTKGLLSVKSAYALIDSTNPELSTIMRDIALPNYLEPNIVIDVDISQKLRKNAYQKALAPIGLLQKGERIIDRGDVVSPQTYTILTTYQKMINDRPEFTNQRHYPFVGQVILVIILLVSNYFFLSLFRWRFFNDMRKMALLMLLITAFTVFAFVVAQHTHYGIYIVPFAMVPILLTTFFDSRTAFYIHVTEIFICSLASTFQMEFLLVQFVAGVTAINSLKELSKRSQLVRCALLVFLSYSITYVALDIVKEGSIDSVNYHFFLYFLINAIFLSFTYVLIFIVEKLFGFISSVTLVELSDVNNHLLRELSEDCPGTFQHSLQVANLASEAARKVNANVQLVRAGALYHDIGKLANPNFFTENQIGPSPHAPISPEQSARIVINHVHDGLVKAEKFKLPKIIRDFISQHHGKGKAKYFYTIACNASPDGKVDGAKFQYPGPNPQTKETAILMMADATEAASRSLQEYDDQSIKTLVNRIINGQISEGLLSESPLSFRDIAAIKEVFTNRLKTIYHTRIAYPELVKPAPEEKENN